MAISYEDARELVRRSVEPGWVHGTFCLDDRVIVEDADIYVFRVGPREYLIDGDESYLMVGGAIAMVDKNDGTFSWMPGNLLYTAHPNLKRRPNPRPTVRI